MSRFLLYSMVLGIFSIFSGCSQHHTIHLDPALPVSRADLGNQKVVELKVTDSRQSQVISKWRGKFFLPSFSISPDREAAEVLYGKIEKGLQVLGFTPRRRAQDSRRSLTVDILQLKSVYHKKGPRHGVKVDAVLRAKCHSATLHHGADYKKRITRSPLPPPSFPNETLVNAALSGSLKKMFADPKLLQCLIS